MLKSNLNLLTERRSVYMTGRYLLKTFVTFVTSGILLFSFSAASAGASGTAGNRCVETCPSLTSAQGDPAKEITTKKRKTAKKKAKKKRKAAKKKTKKKRTAKKRG
jgi:hypothetical protein